MSIVRGSAGAFPGSPSQRPGHLLSRRQGQGAEAKRRFPSLFSSPRHCANPLGELARRPAKTWARLERGGRRLQDLMTEAAAVGLGYTPPHVSPRLESSASSIEEVVLMNDSTDGDGEQDRESDSVAGESVSFLDATHVVAGQANDTRGWSEQKVGEDGEKIEFTTAAPQVSIYRSIDGEDNTGAGGDDSESGEEPRSLSVEGDSSSAAEIKMEAQRPGPVIAATTGVSSVGAASPSPVTSNPQQDPHSMKRKAQQQQLSSITPRRSKRIKQKALPPIPAVSAVPPKAVKRKSLGKTTTVDSDVFEAHFDVVDEAGDAALHMQCKYCGRKLMHRRGAPVRHLNGCNTFKMRMAEENLLAVKIEDIVPHSSTNLVSETALESLGDALVEHKPSVAQGQGVDVTVNQTSALLWLFGSLENANRMKMHYRRAPLALTSPVERLHSLVHDHLSDLDVLQMLTARLAEALDGDLDISLVLGGRKQVRTAVFKVESAARAQEMHKLGLSLSFPAPQHVTNLVVAPLAADMGFSRLGVKHRATIMSCRAKMALEWQLHRSESFVFVLQGSAQWKLKPGGARHPLRCFHPPSRGLEAAADAVKVLALAEDPGGHRPARVSPPVDEADSDGRVFDDMDADRDDVEEKAVEPGAVVYMPAGTWYAVETAADVVWLAVQLLPMTYEQVVLAALRPTLWRSDRWRAPLVLGGAQDHGQTAREHVGELLEDLKQKVAALTPNDVIPEYLLLDKEGDVGPMILEVDLRKSVPFPESSRHLKICNALEFRVNPAAVLLRADEIPHDGRATAALPPVESQSSAVPPPRALQKKQKRNPSMQVPSLADVHAYVLHGEFGNDTFESKLRVNFRCSATQAVLVEWVRDREPLRAFSAEEFQAATDGVDTGAAKRVLRFLRCFGFVSQVKRGDSQA